MRRLRVRYALVESMAHASVFEGSFRVSERRAAAALAGRAGSRRGRGRDCARTPPGECAFGVAAAVVALRRSKTKNTLTCIGRERLRLGVTLKSVTLGNVTMSHRTREATECLASLSHSTMIGLLRAH
ncbi:hypothetical protein EVAR_8329_1 [Eumeta japonica]|uniref:Uncharacterized protein n=1 Tax=Eumeta variegata TaxID=151549 RepID=A0A4C1VCI9_EUMVA|nr:hypothetical protein EVAR_8329_1 [Eumeta japonica]